MTNKEGEFLQGEHRQQQLPERGSNLSPLYSKLGTNLRVDLNPNQMTFSLQTYCVYLL